MTRKYYDVFVRCHKCRARPRFLERQETIEEHHTIDAEGNELDQICPASNTAPEFFPYAEALDPHDFR
jgi:hypothetical protein